MDDETPPEPWRDERNAPTSPDKRQLSVEWMTNYSRHQMNDGSSDDPYSDIMPADLSANRLVNRKEAKRIPPRLLHHNNLSLLRSFMTPTSQIKHRMHTRLGARDHRKVSKLIKRARAMGLVPYTGPFTTEQTGWIHAPDIDKKRDWEEELERRGLVVQEPDKGEPLFKEVDEMLSMEAEELKELFREKEESR